MKLQREGRIRLVQAHSLEQDFKGVDDQGRPFRWDVSRFDGPDRIAGDNVHEVERILRRRNVADIDHVYGAWLNGNNYFVTQNVDDFINNGRREAPEAAMPGLLIRTTDELVRDLG